MEKDEVLFANKNRTLTAYICCELDNHTARRVREKVDREIFLAKPELLVLDFSGVRFMDSSGLALILGRVQTMEAVGGRVQLCGMSEQLMKLVRLSGLERIKSLSLKQ